MSKVGVILSGCGVFDGSEIHEASATLIALAQRGIEYQCRAPDRMFDGIDHRTQKPTGEQRQWRTQSARIALGYTMGLGGVRGGA